jgi:crotonobetainyl-CoA:carnitine CoA-transferase CaiB-like acyl-CoA transferase
LAALREVEVRGGRGQVVDLSLLEPMVAVMGPDVSAFAASGVDAESSRKIASPRGSFRCKDGLWVSMSGSTESMARRVFEAIGQAALFDDPRFATNAARLEHDDELHALVAGFIASLDQDDCLALFRRHGVTVGPIYAPAQLLADPHVAERGVYLRLESGDGKRPTVMHQVTPRLQGTPGSLRRAAPERGEHTQELLQELGATPDERAAMQRKGGIECL